MEPRQSDIERWKLAFQSYVTDHVPLIVESTSIYYNELDEIPVSDELVQLLPQLHVYSKVYPHIIRCQYQYVITGLPIARPVGLNAGQVKHWSVCAAYYAVTDDNSEKNETHMQLKGRHSKVHRYNSCIERRQSSVCSTCNCHFDYSQLLVAHIKQHPSHRTSSIRPYKKAKYTNQQDIVTDIDHIVSDQTDYANYIQHAKPPPQYKRATIVRSATTRYITPLIRVEDLTIQYTIGSILYDYVPAQCRKSNHSNVVNVDTETIDGRANCSITLCGKREHLVWSDPLPYYVLVQNYICAVHNTTFNCLRNNLSPGATITPDIMAVGGSDSSIIGKPTLIDRSFYCNLITRYVSHFNATSLSHDVHAVWQQNWITLNKQHEQLINTNCPYYFDPGIDTNNPNLYYKLACCNADNPDVFQHRLSIINRFGRYCNEAPSADFIDSLFYQHYVPYELVRYMSDTTTMVYQWGAEFLCSDHTFRAVKSVHLFNSENMLNRRSERRATSRSMVNCVLSTLMDLQSELVLSSKIVPSTECHYVSQQIDEYLKSQQYLPPVERRPLHSVGVDNAVSFGPSILTSTYESLIRHHLVPDEILHAYNEVQTRNSNQSAMTNTTLIEFFQQYPQYRIYCTEDVWHLKQRILDKGTYKHRFEKQWRIYVHTIFAGITSGQYRTADELTVALNRLLYAGSNPTSQLSTVSTHGNMFLPKNISVEPISSITIHRINQHRINQHTLQYEYEVVLTNSAAAQWFTYVELDRCCTDASKQKLHKYLHGTLPVDERPLLNTSGRKSLQLMIKNVDYIYSIIKLKQLYPHLYRNSGTNLLEARHSVLNSMKPKKGTVKFQHIRHIINVKTLQHNLRRLFRLANRDFANVNFDTIDADTHRIRRLRKSLRSAFSEVLPSMQTDWLCDNEVWFPSPNWLPVYGHSRGLLWKPWSIIKTDIDNVNSINQFKLYTNKRLGNISGVDIVHMVLEFNVYQQAEQVGAALNQDVRHLKHHLASKVFNNQRTVDECDYIIQMLAGLSDGFATIRNIRHSHELDTAASEVIKHFMPAPFIKVSDNDADQVFDQLMTKITSGQSNKQRIRILFDNIDSYHKLTETQLRNCIGRYQSVEQVSNTNVSSTVNDSMATLDDNDCHTTQLNDNDIIEWLSDISDIDTAANTPVKAKYNSVASSHVQ